MSKHEIKICQRCNNSFECKMGDIANCQCSQITLTEASIKFLEKTNYDCLCQNCLNAINQLTAKCKKSIFPKNSNQLKNEEHYYIENGNLVFTEYYHMLRGNCCGNGCRHCAYGN